MKQKPISARINNEVLEYIKGCHQPVNSLINQLLQEWMKKRQDKELLLFQEETGTDYLKQLAERHTELNSQCCNNCKYMPKYTNTCVRTGITNHNLIPKNKFCCIYWEHRKKERR